MLLHIESIHVVILEQNWSCLHTKLAVSEQLSAFIEFDEYEVVYH